MTKGHMFWLLKVRTGMDWGCQGGCTLQREFGTCINLIGAIWIMLPGISIDLNTSLPPKTDHLIQRRQIVDGHFAEGIVSAHSMPGTSHMRWFPNIHWLIDQTFFFHVTLILIAYTDIIILRTCVCLIVGTIWTIRHCSGHFMMCFGTCTEVKCQCVLVECVQSMLNFHIFLNQRKCQIWIVAFFSLFFFFSNTILWLNVSLLWMNVVIWRIAW